MRRINLLVVAVAAAGLLALPAGAQAKVIKVHPGDSIQAAVDQAHPGDTVKVAPGTYTEASQPCPSEPANSCAVVVRKDGISIVRQSRNHGTRGNHGNRVVLQAGEDQDTFHTVWVAWSDDGGQTWTDHIVFDGGFGHDASALFADFTLDRRGNPYVAFGDNLRDEWDMYVMASFNGGRSWNGKSDGSGRPLKVNGDQGTHFFPAIAAGDPGKVDVAYIGTPTRIATLPYGKPSPGGGDGAKWYAYSAQSLNVDATHPTWSVRRLTRAPIHEGDVCTLGIFCSVFPSANRELLDFIDAAIDRSGRAHVAFTQDTDQHNGIYVANQTSGQGVGSP